MPHEFFTAYLNIVFDNFVQKTAVNVFTAVVWNNSGSSVRMLKEHMASFLPLEDKPKFFKNTRNFSCIEEGKF